MALRIKDTYVNTTPPSAEYPDGSAKNETAPGALDGTPLEKAIYNDILGLMQSLIVAGGEVATNTADNVRFPQYLTSIFNLRYYDRVDYKIGSKAVGSDTKTYVCIGLNGPATTAQDPVTETAPRTKWLTEAAALFDVQHPIGSYWFSELNQPPSEFLGVGVWQRVLGRFLVGRDEADSDFNLPGETGGSKAHTHGNTLSTDGAGNHTHTVSIDAWGSVQSGGALPEPTTEGRLVTGSGLSDPSEDLESLAHADTNRATSLELDHTHTLSGGVSSVQSLPPYIVTHIWKRTA